MLNHFEKRQDVVLFIDSLRHRKPFNGLVQVMQPPRLLEKWILPSMSFRYSQNFAARIDSRDTLSSWKSRGTFCEDPSSAANVEIPEAG